MTKAQQCLSLLEVSPHRVTRVKGKKIFKKLVCDPGFVIDGSGCRKLSRLEIIHYKKGAKKRKKKLKGRRVLMTKRRLQSLGKRHSLGL